MADPDLGTPQPVCLRGLVDTGAEISVLGASAIQRLLFLPESGAVRIQGVQSALDQSGEGWAPTRYAGVTMEGVTKRLKLVHGQFANPDMVIGMDLLCQFDFTLRGRRGELVITPARP